MKYDVGTKVCISIDAMINGDANMEFVDIVTEHDEDGTWYQLYNETGDLCCLDGEECVIDHIVNGTENVYDLVNNNGGDTVHFILTERDLDIATFR